MIEIEFFPKVSDRSEHSVQGLDRLLHWSTTNDKLKQKTFLYKQWLSQNPNATPKEKSAKKVYYFPAVTFGGTFTSTGKAEDIKNLSGLIVLDFDHIVNLAEIQNQLKSDPYIFLMFVSPSGDGLKVVVKHNLKDPQKWQYLYFELEAYYLQMFSLETDRSGKDVSRMCFLPYIADLYRNNNSVIWQYTGEHEKQPTAPVLEGCKEFKSAETTDNLYTECLYISAYLFEHKISIAENYQDWLSYGYSLCELGEKGRDIFHNISCTSEKYDNDECDNQFDVMLENYDPDRTNINIFINNGKRAIAHHTIYVTYGFLCS